MQYTTHGLMTPADLADHQNLTDTGIHPGCPGHYEDPGPIAHCSIVDDCPDIGGDVMALDFDTTALTLHTPARNRGLTVHERICNYQAQSGRERLTARQRRRMLKKAGRDPQVTVVRDDGMGYPPNMQGYREIVGDVRPVSGGPV